MYILEAFTTTSGNGWAESFCDHRSNLCFADTSPILLGALSAAPWSRGGWCLAGWGNGEEMYSMRRHMLNMKSKHWTSWISVQEEKMIEALKKVKEGGRNRLRFGALKTRLVTLLENTDDKYMLFLCMLKPSILKDYIIFLQVLIINHWGQEGRNITRRKLYTGANTEIWIWSCEILVYQAKSLSTAWRDGDNSAVYVHLSCQILSSLIFWAPQAQRILSEGKG